MHLPLKRVVVKQKFGCPSTLDLGDEEWIMGVSCSVGQATVKNNVVYVYDH